MVTHRAYTACLRGQVSSNVRRQKTIASLHGLTIQMKMTPAGLPKGIPGSVVENIAFLEEFSNQEFDASSFDGVMLCGKNYRNITIRGVRRSLQLGSTTSPARFLGCTFQAIRVQHLTLGIADYTDCSFLDIKVKQFGSRSANADRLKFTGAIARGIVGISADNSLREGDEKLHWTASDFSECVLGDFEFRGGIALSTFTFSPDDLGRVIIKAERLRSVSESAELTSEQRAICATILAFCRIYRQQDYFVPLPFLKEWGQDLRTLLNIAGC